MKEKLQPSSTNVPEHAAAVAFTVLTRNGTIIRLLNGMLLSAATSSRLASTVAYAYLDKPHYLKAI